MYDIRERAPVSIICVSNDRTVLADCLARSVEIHRPAAPDTELIVVGNVDGEFSTAGAALNHGVRLARNPVCAFVHQDVYLHSLVRLEQAAAVLLNDPAIGLLGALGITADGALRGRIRDRVMLLGRAVEGPVDVDSLDEVHFMARRELLHAAPLTEDPELAWHAYAVEYAARMQHQGRRVVAGRIPLTHNSLTTNLDRLVEAHHHVGLLYPDQVPIKTTCGVVDGTSPERTKVLARHRWRYRWLRGSWRAYLAQRVIGDVPIVLSDIRMNIDSVLAHCDARRLTVISIASAGEADIDLAGPIRLERLGRSFTFEVADLRSVVHRVGGGRSEESLLVTNLDGKHLPALREVISDTDALLGYAEPIGFWLVTGSAAQASPEAWQCASATPLRLQVTR